MPSAPHSARRSVDLVFEMTGIQGELDPNIHLLSRKLVLLYRILHKYPSMHTKVVALVSAYETQHHKGTTRWLGLPGEDTHHHNLGPISHLLVALHAVGATIDSSLNHPPAR